jgi:hypothetical protein
MGSHVSHRAVAAALSLITMGATALILTAGSTAAQAAVWTDQGDYPPGSVVTIHGDNSDGAGYQANEAIHVDVNGPGSIGPSCDATADDSGAWSCQITLGTGAAAIGGYTYIATGQSSGVSQSGTFTDSGCKDAHAAGTVLPSTDVTASFTTSGSTATYRITTPSDSPSGGVPGLIEYCVFPGSSPFPNTVQALYKTASQDLWHANIDATNGYFDFERPHGDPTNLPFDGTTQTVGTATWSGAVPSAQQIVLHINDPKECDQLYGGNPGTCFVLPATNQDLTVRKTATPSFTHTYTWGITKGVDPAERDISGGLATFHYTVSVTHDTGTDGNWQVTGTITVHNPNSEAVTLAGVTDTDNAGGTCKVSGDTGQTIPANSDSTGLGYTCTYTSNPGQVTDTATATWNATAASTPHGSASGSADADFGGVNPTPVDDSVTVTDTFGGTLGTVTATDLSPTTFTYDHSFPGVAGQCTSYPNTATFTTNTSGTTRSASQSATVCQGADLTVTKTATPSFTRNYNWSIAKNVDKTLFEQIGGTVTANYTVSVNQTGFTDSDSQVTGTITVHNPNHWEAVQLTGVTDTDNGAGGTCTVSGDTGQTIPANSDSTGLGYTCTYTSNPGHVTDTATATWNATAASTPHGSANGSADAAFGDPTTTVNKTITVTDKFNGTTTTLGTLTATDAQPFTSHPYTYSRTLNVPQFNCATYPNTAKIVETGQMSGQSVEVCGPAKTGALTMGFWQNKNGQSIITGQAKTGACPSAAWLTQYAPFQDLSSTATCSTVATYVTNIIKAANASGSAMNAMLKAQMLATALDVYFSDPALGGNKINAPAPIGGVVIDLTKICHMIDSSSGGTCSGTYEDVRSAFGVVPPATSLAVSDMLSYAASQSNSGGSTWYGNVKATQQLAKDAFDAINNQVAFAP